MGNVRTSPSCSQFVYIDSIISPSLCYRFPFALEEQLAYLEYCVYWEQGNNRPGWPLLVGEKQDTLSRMVFLSGILKQLVFLGPVMVSLTHSNIIWEESFKGLSTSDWPVQIFVEYYLDC